MRYRILFLIIVIFIVITMGCSEKITDPLSSGSTYYTFGNFIHFDTTHYIWAERNIGGCGAYEYAVSTEQSLGEPFTDINGNGVYDEGVDIFIMSAGPDNQDYDRNARYTGPDEPWVPGIPFDDLNGNNQYDQNSSDYYEDGFPFCDLNFNSVRDYNTDFVLTPYKITSKINFPGICDYYLNHVCDTTIFSFTSDSNITYEYEFSCGMADHFYHHFTMTPYELIFHGTLLDFTILNRYGLYEYDNQEVVLSGPNIDEVIYLKTIRFNDSISSLGTDYYNLISIEFLKKPGQTANTFNFRFYFDIDLGFVGYTSTHSNCLEHYFCRRFDSLPIPMTRIEPDPGILAKK